MGTVHCWAIRKVEVVPSWVELILHKETLSFLELDTAAATESGSGILGRFPNVAYPLLQHLYHTGGLEQTLLRLGLSK